MQTMWKTLLSALLSAAGIVFAAQAAAQITFYEGEGFRGRTFMADRTIENFDRSGFNDRASSAIVNGGSWQACEDAFFAGRCGILRPGGHEWLAGVGVGRRRFLVPAGASNCRH